MYEEVSEYITGLSLYNQLNKIISQIVLHHPFCHAAKMYSLTYTDNVIIFEAGEQY